MINVVGDSVVFSKVPDFREIGSASTTGRSQLGGAAIKQRWTVVAICLCCGRAPSPSRHSADSTPGPRTQWRARQRSPP